MKVIRPIEITPAKILSSSATEIYSAWSSATTYAEGNRALYNNRIYESLINTNLNKQPDTNPTAWLDIAPNNKTAMFDQVVNTQTTAITSLTVTFQPGMVFNSVAFLNIQGNSINVQVKKSPTGSVVYDQTIGLDYTDIFDWYGYFFEPFDLRDTVVLTDIPPYTNSVIKITINGTGSVSLGNFIYGTATEIGATQYGVTFGIRDYSIKDTDDFGNTIFVKRAFSRRMEPQLMLDNTKIRYVSKLLSELRATPTVWVGSEDAQYEPLVIFGFYKDYTIDIQYPSASLIRVEIEGLS